MLKQVAEPTASTGSRNSGFTNLQDTDAGCISFSSVSAGARDASGSLASNDRREVDEVCVDVDIVLNNVRLKHAASFAKRSSLCMTACLVIIW